MRGCRARVAGFCVKPTMPERKAMGMGVPRYIHRTGACVEHWERREDKRGRWGGVHGQEEGGARRGRAS